MTQEDLIHQRLGDPRIIDVHIDEDQKGTYVEVEVQGTEKHLRRLVEEHFDIDGEVLETADSPTIARLRPKW